MHQDFEDRSAPLTPLAPLERRVYKHKGAHYTYFCPLCRSERYMTKSFRLSIIHYIQIAILSGIFIAVTYNFFSYRAFFIVFFLLGIYEFVLRYQYRKDLPCPYCGFDAAWYKRNVPMARKVVEEFWNQKKSA